MIVGKLIPKLQKKNYISAFLGFFQNSMWCLKVILSFWSSEIFQYCFHPSPL